MWPHSYAHRIICTANSFELHGLLLDKLALTNSEMHVPRSRKEHTFPALPTDVQQFLGIPLHCTLALKLNMLV